VDLNGVTLDQALDVVSLESRTFWRPVTPNTIFVAQDTRQKRTELEQNVVKTFYLSNLSQPTEIQEVVNALRTILEITRVQPITAQGAIVVRGTPDQVALAEKLVQDFDKAPAEVVIDVAIMQVTRDKIRDLGIQPPGSTSVALQGNITPATSTTTGGTTTTTPSTATSTGTINLNNFAHLNATDFVVTIPQATANFLLTDSDTKIIQKPQLRASDGQKATLKIGDRIPVATGSFQPGIGGIGINPLVNTQFQYTDVGVNIDITPRVHAAREVSLKMTLEISSVTSHVNIGGIDQPVIGQRKVDHEIRLKEGEVNLLGGIFEDQDIKSLAGIPGLAQIPLFRYLFSSQHTETRRNEIVFLLVPHIVRSHDIDEMNLRAIDAGTGSAIELRLTPAAAGNGGAGGGATTQAGRIGGANRTTGTTASGGSQMPQSIPAQAAPAGAATQEGGTSAAQRGAQPAFGAAQGASRSAGTATEAAGTQLLFDPPIINQPAGSTFTVNVVLSGAQDVYSAPIQLQYDPARLQLLNVSNGSFLSRDGQVVVLTHREDANNGSAQISASRPPGAPGVSGDGPVYTLTFLAKSSGNTTLTMTRAMLRNPSNQSMPVTAGQAQVSIK
jgi:general secretion pathway protein D